VPDHLEDDVEHAVHEDREPHLDGVGSNGTGLEGLGADVTRPDDMLVDRAAVGQESRSGDPRAVPSVIAMTAAPRSRAQRRHDTGHRLAHDVDLWVASASTDGAPYLVPLSFDWDGEAVLLATPSDSPTGRNLAATRAVRLALGPTRDVTLIDGDVEVLGMDALPGESGDRFAARAGFDPRTLTTPYRWFRVVPRRVQAWREVDELPGRLLMRDGHWLV
jgi:hypothetical protein